MKEKLKALVDRALPKILAEFHISDSPKSISYDIALPKIKAHGDLSVNLAFQIGRLAKKNPFDVAQICKSVLNQIISEHPSSKQWISEINVEKPGFINFKLAEESIAEILLRIKQENETFGRAQVGAGTKVMIEFVSANPTGPLTIAHGRQAALGDALARILKAVGYSVHTEFYLNDLGRQVRLLGESLWVRYQELFGKSEPLPEDGYQGAYLMDVAKSLKAEKNDQLFKAGKEKSIQEVTSYAVNSILAGIKNDLKDLDVTFDQFFSERSLTDEKLIDGVLKTLKEKGLIYETEGALWFKSTTYGDDKDRVLRKQTGEYTYLMPDIAYHQTKFNRGFQKLINLWGPDHHGYIPRLKAACQALGYQPKQLEVLIVQLTTLYRKGEPVKMSTRAGEFVTLRELMDEVGVDATRFFFLMRKIDSHLDFDLELAKQKSDENPVYYVQYAHARISSILEFASSLPHRGYPDPKEKIHKMGLRGGQRPTKQSKTEIASLTSFARNDGEVDLSLIREEEALVLIKKMSEFSEVLTQAAEHSEPYRLVDYLRELAALFHKFYAQHRIVSEDEALTKARLLITDCTRVVLRNGLSLLGVSAPSKM